MRNQLKKALLAIALVTLTSTVAIGDATAASADTVQDVGQQLPGADGAEDSTDNSTDQTGIVPKADASGPHVQDSNGFIGIGGTELTSTVSSTGERVGSKADYLAENDIAGGGMTLDSSTTKTDTDTASVMDSEIRLDTTQTGDFYNKDIFTVAYSGSGDTVASWYGLDPYNADKISMRSEITVNGAEVELTVAASPSLTVTGGGNSAVYSGTFEDEWTVEHHYSGLEATSNIALYGAKQQDSATFRFGNEDHTIFTNTRVDAGLL